MESPLKVPDIPGWFDWAPWAKDVVAALPNSAVYIELGCFLGKSTCAIGKMVQDSGKQIALYAIDRFELPETLDPDMVFMLGLVQKGTRTFDHIFEDHVWQSGLQGIIHTVKSTSIGAASLFQPSSVDVVFVDADHSYDAVRADIQHWWDKLKPGGIMAGHDIFTYDSVGRAVRDEFKARRISVKTYSGQNIWEVRKP